MKSMYSTHSHPKRARTATRLVPMIVLALFIQTSQAHHGKDFLAASSCATPHAGSLCGHFSAQSYIRSHSSESELLFSPGLIYGISEKIGLEFHSHLSAMSASTHVEALALEARYAIFSETDNNVIAGETTHSFSLATSLEFENGIAEHHDVLETRLILGKGFGFITLVGNLVMMQEFAERQHAIARFVIGMKTRITNGIGLMIEVMNNDHHIEQTQLSIGWSMTLMKAFDVAVGTHFTDHNHGPRVSSFQSMMMYTF